MRHLASSCLTLATAAALFWTQDARAQFVEITTTTTLPGECGDFVREANEDCDNGDVPPVAGQACAAGCLVRPCGKATGSPAASPLVSDAQFALRASVGAASCDPCVCDTDANGNVVTSDALRILRFAVGQAVSLNCTACADLRRQGRFLVQEKFPIPAEAREGVLLEAEHIEVQGVDLADDGSVVTWPARGAGGWIVTIGDATAITDTDGYFRITIPGGGTTTGTIAHPQEPETALFAITAAELFPLDVEPEPLVFEREFYGPCGMNEDEAFPDPAVCSEIVPPVSTLIGPTSMDEAHASHEDPLAGMDGDAADVHAHHHHAAMHDDGGTSGVVDRVANGQSANQEPPFTTGPRGTYPAGGQKCCKDYDGGTYDGETLSGVILNYYGSTCQKYISSGCCGGELGSLVASAKAALGLITPKSCQKNHRGRYCQELKEGDISIEVNGQVAHANVSIGPKLNLGESLPVVVHNNGCFGDTTIEREITEIYGVVTGAGFDGAKLDHAFTGTYTPDVTVTYSTLRCMEPMVLYAHDLFRFGADGRFAEAWFTLSPEGLYKFLPDGPVFSANASNKYAFNIAGADLCDGLHVHGQHPCTGQPEPGSAGPCGHGRVEPYDPPIRGAK